MPFAGTQHTATRERQSEHGLPADLPHKIALRRDDLVAFGDRQQRRCCADKIADRDPCAIGKHDQRLAGNTFAQVRHHRPLVRPLLQRAIEL